MNKLFARVISLMLALVITFTSFDINVYAASIDSADQNTDVTGSAAQGSDETAGQTGSETTQSATSEQTGTSEASETDSSTESGSSSEATEGNDVSGEAGSSDVNEENGKEVTEEGEELEEVLLAEEEEEEEELLKASDDGWEIDENGVLTFDEEVKEISEEQFKGNTDITAVVFPSKLRKIGRSAFNGCTGITEVTIPESVTVIYPYAFKNSGVKRVVVNPARLNAKYDSNWRLTASTSFGSSFNYENLNASFMGCTLENLEFGPNVVVIPELFAGVGNLTFCPRR